MCKSSGAGLCLGSWRNSEEARGWRRVSKGGGQGGGGAGPE